jgi:hypothetical protein
LIVERYSEANADAWDGFVRSSRNGTFLFERAYMDYHRDRFHDHSLIIRDDSGELLALLPAHGAKNRLISHGGLSYGGLLTNDQMKLPRMLAVFDSLLTYLQSNTMSVLEYKTIPGIYHSLSADYDLYPLFLSNAQLIRRDMLAVVAREERLSYQSRRLRGIKKAQKLSLTIREQEDFAPYWELLSATLQERHQADPVHSLQEIQQLKSHFPRNIRLFEVDSSEGLLAGVLIYETPRVAHCQYIASSPVGRERGALDLLFDHLLTTIYREHPYFDFGSSHEDKGRILNIGLVEQKEGFGARPVAHDHYRIDVANYRQGQLLEACR